MKTVNDIAKSIRKQIDTDADVQTFDSETQLDKHTTMFVCGTIERTFVETWGGEYCGCREQISECTSETMTIESIGVYNDDGKEIPTPFTQQEIEQAFMCH
jgi:hypothetical protein